MCDRDDRLLNNTSSIYSIQWLTYGSHQCRFCTLIVTIIVNSYRISLLHYNRSAILDILLRVWRQTASCRLLYFCLSESRCQRTGFIVDEMSCLVSYLHRQINCLLSTNITKKSKYILRKQVTQVTTFLVKAFSSRQSLNGQEIKKYRAEPQFYFIVGALQ